MGEKGEEQPLGEARVFMVSPSLTPPCIMHTLMGDACFTSRGPFYILILCVVILARVISVSGIWMPTFQGNPFLCALESRQRALQWNIFLKAEFLPPEHGHKLSVFQKQHRLVFLCRFPAAFATSALERCKGLRNTAKEKGIPEATRRVVTSECVFCLQGWAWRGWGSLVKITETVCAANRFYPPPPPTTNTAENAIHQNVLKSSPWRCGNKKGVRTTVR